MFGGRTFTPRDAIRDLAGHQFHRMLGLSAAPLQPMPPQLDLTVPDPLCHALSFSDTRSRLPRRPQLPHDKRTTSL